MLGGNAAHSLDVYIPSARSDVSAMAGPVVVIPHVDGSDIDWVGEALDRRVPWRLVRPYLGESLPPLDHELGGVVCLGGPMSAVDDAQYPFLRDEKEYLRAATECDIPVLAICLGSQLLADALGGRSLPDLDLEFGRIEIELTPEGRQDSVLSGIGGRHFSFHSDSWELPPDATLLARSDRHPQAFRMRRSLAVQFHPELSPAGLQALIDVEGPKLAAGGVDVPAMVAEFAANAQAAHGRFGRLVDRWLAHRR